LDDGGFYAETKGGLNLRDDLAHGLLPPNAFNRQIADRVFHSLLALSPTREQPSDVRHNPSPSKAGGNEPTSSKALRQPAKPSRKGYSSDI